MNNFISKV